MERNGLCPLRIRNHSLLLCSRAQLHVVGVSHNLDCLGSSEVETCVGWDVTDDIVDWSERRGIEGRMYYLRESSETQILIE